MEIKKEIFKRVPPGDRWVELNGDPNKIFDSLTEALEYYFQKTKTRQYYIDAGLGYIYKIDEVEDPIEPPKMFSLYGDGY
jgi:hypothetical protein